jgi:hypothetical protein
VDGYEIMPRQSKEVNRNFYSMFPTASDRERVGDKEKKLLRAWYRKYPTKAEQIANPIEKFVPAKSPYQLIREYTQNLIEGWGIRIRSKNNPEGPISAKHFMPLVQKLTASIHDNLLTTIYQLEPNYDFTADPKGIKSKRVRKHTMKVLLEPKGKSNYLWITLLANTDWIATAAIPKAIKDIDDNRGKITCTLSRNSEGKPTVNINDTTVNETKTKTKLANWTRDELLGRMPKK